MKALPRDAQKNRSDPAGHNPQLGSFIPLYLPHGRVLAGVVDLRDKPADRDWVLVACGRDEEE